MRFAAVVVADENVGRLEIYTNANMFEKDSSVCKNERDAKHKRDAKQSRHKKIT